MPRSLTHRYDAPAPPLPRVRGDRLRAGLAHLLRVPRVVRRWRRGTPLAAAQLVYEGEAGDVSVSAFHDPTRGYERDFVWRYLDFYRSEQELFGAVVAAVPLLDMRRYTKLLAGASWIAEYGDPDDEDQWAYLREYSPYHNVRPGRAYPPVLLITSIRDDRVHPGHARKMVALLRAHGYDVSYYENVEGGHGAAADNGQAAMIWALTLDFLWRRLTRSPR